MAYNEKLAARIRTVLKRRRGITEKKMFGGLAFLWKGHMVCGALEDRLVVRLGHDGAAEGLRRKHTAPMDFTGKPLRSMLYVKPPGCRTEAALRKWLDQALAFARTLPEK